MDFLSPFSDPARHEVFSFTPEWLRAQFARDHDPRNPDYAVALKLTIPPEQLMTHRVWLGIVGLCVGSEPPFRCCRSCVAGCPGSSDHAVRPSGA